MKHLIITSLMLLLVASSGALTLSYWTGTSSTNWHNAGNWTAGVPNATTQAMIQTVTNGRYPVINTTNAVCQRLSLLADASLTVGTANLNIEEYALIWGQLIMSSATDLSTGGNIGWLEGATVSIGNSSAEIYCGQSMYFEPDSNVQFSQGYVEFSNLTGINAYIKNNSPNTILPTVRSRNSSGGIFYIHGDSTEDIVLNGNFSNYEGCSFRCEHDKNMVVRGNFKDYNTTAGKGVWLYSGTLTMDGNTQTMELVDGLSFLNNLTCSPSNALNLTTDLLMRGTLTIQSGIFNPNGHEIRIRGNWVNLAGPASFLETGSTVTFEADWDQYCNYDEDFNNLVVNKNTSYFIVNQNVADVTCTTYEWIDGGVKVILGSFSAGSLVNNRIAGEWIQTGGSINLTNTGALRYVDLAGSLTLSGGVFNVYGGYDLSWWPYSSGASLTMSGGTLDFKDQGVKVQVSGHPFTANLTGGTIRVAGSFVIERAGFNPSGGVVVLAGSTDCSVSHVAGSSFYALDINKYSESKESEAPTSETDRAGNTRDLTRARTVTATSNLDINSSFFLRSGYFTAPAQMNVRRNWYHYTDYDSFNEGSGKVIFDGNADSSVTGEEEFNALELAKGASPYKLIVPNSGEAVCDSYDWTQGTLSVSGGLFYALDMEDTVIQGSVELSSGSIILVQDTTHPLHLRGFLNISGGELHIWGGTADMGTAMPSGGNAGLTMSGGLFHRHGSGIGLYSGTFTLNLNITGGIIRTDGNFYCERSDFTPGGGELNLTGSTNSYLTLLDGSLYGLRINKDSGASVTLMSNLALGGVLTVEAGTLHFNAKQIHTAGNVVVHGTLHLSQAAVLYMNNTRYLNIESGGRLEAIGSSDYPAAINTDAGFFYLNVRSGATISASYCIFAEMSQYGINVRPGATIDPEHSFDYCQFIWGVEGGVLLTIDNSDYVGIISPQFLTNAGGGASNVRKTVDEGIVNIVNAIGGFSGEAYDNDVHNRVLWNTGNTQPDLQIIATEWVPDSPDAYLGDWLTLKVTLVNNSTQPLEQLFYVDLYHDRETEPLLYLLGEQTIDFTFLPAGLPVDVYFPYVSNYGSAGPWNSWLQIDPDGFVTESSENNNVFGPFDITWLDLPVPEPVTTYLATPDDVLLSWTYPISVDHFNVYSDTDPYGTFTTLAGYSLTNSFTDTAPVARKFYRVRAVRLQPGKTEDNPPRFRD